MPRSGVPIAVQKRGACDDAPALQCGAACWIAVGSSIARNDLVPTAAGWDVFAKCGELGESSNEDSKQLRACVPSTNNGH